MTTEFNEHFPGFATQMTHLGNAIVYGAQAKAFIQAGSDTLSTGNKTVTFTTTFLTGTTPFVEFHLRNKAQTNGGKISSLAVTGFTIVCSGGSTATADWLALGQYSE